MKRQKPLMCVRIIGAVMMGVVLLFSGVAGAADSHSVMMGDSIFVDNAWDVAMTFGGRPPSPSERAEIERTLLAVYDGWRMLDFDLYMSAWSIHALQIFMDGTRRDYTAIANKRKKDFNTYRRVEVYWEMLDNEVKYENRAYVVTRYTMTFYRQDGSSFTESAEELYVMELQSNGRWLIIENYDYIAVPE